MRRLAGRGTAPHPQSQYHSPAWTQNSKGRWVHNLQVEVLLTLRYRMLESLSHHQSYGVF